MIAPQIVDGAADARVLIVADHASNAVPPGIDLGLDAEVMGSHIAIDIGVGELSCALAGCLHVPAVIATVSRLVIDLNRETDSSGLVPQVSDGRTIPGNDALSPSERERRIAAFHTPYHRAIEAVLDSRPIALIVAVHSFTPALASRPDEARPWEIGVLHNQDSRAATHAIARLRALKLRVGDNEPYSGRVLNYTMNRHAEARGLPYIGLEIRQDLLLTPADVARWRDTLAPVIEGVLKDLAAQ